MSRRGEIDPVVLEVLEVYSLSSSGLTVTSGGAVVASAETRGGLEGPLAEHIYRTLHSGTSELASGLSREDIIDQDLQVMLETATPKENLRRKVPILERRSDCLVVGMSGVRVFLHADRFEEILGEENVWVSMPSLRPFVSPGFSYYESSASVGFRADNRVYVNLARSADAPIAWEAIHQLVKQFSPAYHAKIASAGMLYPRRDALVLYLPEVEMSDLKSFAAQLVQTGVIGPQISRLVLELAPGVGFAVEPRDETLMGAKTSFGQHRSTLLAQAVLLPEAGTGPGSGSDLVNLFQESNVDLAAIFRNHE